MYWRDLEPDEALYRHGGRFSISAAPYPGLRLTVETPKRPALRFEFASPLLFRLVAGATNVLWGRIDDYWFRVELVRDEPLPDSIVPPLRAHDIDALDVPHGSARWYAHWSRAYARSLAASPLTPLHAGSWVLVPRTEPTSTRDTSAPSRELDTLDRDTSARPLFLRLYAGAANTVALRRLGDADDSRVKMWRKRARDGSLPPLLVLYVSAFERYLLLDGHDRLAAAYAEEIAPPVIALVPLREQVHAPDPAKQAAVLGAVAEMQERQVPTDTVNRVMLSVFDDRPRAVPWSRVWPLLGGKAAWRDGVLSAAVRMDEGERSSLVWGV